jgi:hypothetical protein
MKIKILFSIFVLLVITSSVAAVEYSIGEEPDEVVQESSTGGSSGGGGGGGGSGGLRKETVNVVGQISTFTVERRSNVYLDIDGFEYRLRIDKMDPYSGEVTLRMQFPKPQTFDFVEGTEYNVDYDEDGKDDFSIKLDEWASARFASFIIDPVNKQIKEPLQGKIESPKKEPVKVVEKSSGKETQNTGVSKTPLVDGTSSGKRAAKSVLFAFVVVVGAIATVFIFRKRFFRLKTSSPESKHRYVEMLKKNIDMLRKEGFNDNDIQKGLLSKGWPKNVVEKELKKKQNHIKKK